MQLTFRAWSGHDMGKGGCLCSCVAPALPFNNLCVELGSSPPRTSAPVIRNYSNILKSSLKSSFSLYTFSYYSQ